MQINRAKKIMRTAFKFNCTLNKNYQVAKEVKCRNKLSAVLYFKVYCEIKHKNLFYKMNNILDVCLRLQIKGRINKTKINTIISL